MKTINKKLILTLIAGLTAAPLSAAKHNVSRQQLVRQALALGLSSEKADTYNMSTLKRFITRTQNQQAAGPTHVAPTTGFNKLTHGDIANIHEWLPVKESAALMATSKSIRHAGEQETGINRPHAITAIVNKYPAAKQLDTPDIEDVADEVIDNALREAIKAGNQDDAAMLLKHDGNPNLTWHKTFYGEENYDEDVIREVATFKHRAKILIDAFDEMTDETLSYLAQLKNLKRVDLFDTNITSLGLRNIATSENISEVILGFCRLIRSEDLQHLQQLKSLKN